MMQIRVVVLRESSFQMQHKAFFRRLRKGNLRLNYKVLKRSRNTMLGCLSRWSQGGKKQKRRGHNFFWIANQLHPPLWRALSPHYFLNYLGLPRTSFKLPPCVREKLFPRGGYFESASTRKRPSSIKHSKINFKSQNFAVLQINHFKRIALRKWAC